MSLPARAPSGIAEINSPSVSKICFDYIAFPTHSMALGSGSVSGPALGFSLPASAVHSAHICPMLSAGTILAYASKLLISSCSSYR